MISSNKYTSYNYSVKQVQNTKALNSKHYVNSKNTWKFEKEKPQPIIVEAEVGANVAVDAVQGKEEEKVKKIEEGEILSFNRQTQTNKKLKRTQHIMAPSLNTYFILILLTLILDKNIVDDKSRELYQFLNLHCYQ